MDKYYCCDKMKEAEWFLEMKAGIGDIRLCEDYSCHYIENPLFCPWCGEDLKELNHLFQFHGYDFAYAREMLKAIRMMANAGAMKVDWILETENKPEEYQNVLVFNGKDVSEAYWDGSRWEVCWHCDTEEVKGVTHWMLVPKPPQ